MEDLGFDLALGRRDAQLGVAEHRQQIPGIRNMLLVIDRHYTDRFPQIVPIEVLPIGIHQAEKFIRGLLGLLEFLPLQMALQVPGKRCRS